MDCDTTGIEPDFSLVKFKKLAGGGYFKIINQSVPKALHNLDTTKNKLKRSLPMLLDTQLLEGCPHVNGEFLTSKGLSKKRLNLSKHLFTERLISTLFSPDGLLVMNF